MRNPAARGWIEQLVAAPQHERGGASWGYWAWGESVLGDAQEPDTWVHRGERWHRRDCAQDRGGRDEHEHELLPGMVIHTAGRAGIAPCGSCVGAEHAWVGELGEPLIAAQIALLDLWRELRRGWGVQARAGADAATVLSWKALRPHEWRRSPGGARLAQVIDIARTEVLAQLGEQHPRSRRQSDESWWLCEQTLVYERCFTQAALEDRAWAEEREVWAMLTESEMSQAARVGRRVRMGAGAWSAELVRTSLSLSGESSLPLEQAVAIARACLAQRSATEMHPVGQAGRARG